MTRAAGNPLETQTSTAKAPPAKVDPSLFIEPGDSVDAAFVSALACARPRVHYLRVNGIHLARLGAHKPHAPTGVVRTVQAPDGAMWEISASRLVSPQWRPGDLNPSMMGVRAGAFFDEGPLSAVFNGMLLPMFRYMVELPSAIAKGRNSKVIWIAAKSYYPVQESYYWRTSADHVVGAIDDIARGLREGETVPRSMRASYHGTNQRWTGDGD